MNNYEQLHSSGNYCPLAVNKMMKWSVLYVCCLLLTLLQKNWDGSEIHQVPLTIHIVVLKSYLNYIDWVKIPWDSTLVGNNFPACWTLFGTLPLVLHVQVFDFFNETCLKTSQNDLRSFLKPF